jgi:glycosyltransferase involved in cell wall biosynthesis
MTSVLSQDWPDVEYLVVDPGSTDHTASVIRGFQEKYPGKIVLISEPDAGPADGLNKAFARATGDLFGYLNADDLYLPGCFRKAAAAAKRYPKAAAFYADGYKADAEENVTRHVVSTGFSPRRFVYGGSLTLQQSTFYRGHAFREISGFNLENRTSWDAEILLEMALRGMQLVHVPGYWSVFRIHAESITGSQRLAEESRRTHTRYFMRVMGRPRNSWDNILSKAVMALSLLREPRGTAMRIFDRIGNPGINVSELLRVR